MRASLARSALVSIAVALPFAAFASFAGCTSPTLPVGIEAPDSGPRSLAEAGKRVEDASTEASATLPACSWPASLDDAAPRQCSAARAYVACNLTSGVSEDCMSDDPTTCPDASAASCTDLCHADEYAVGCGGVGPEPSPPLPSGCRSLPAGPGGGVLGCCPCEAAPAAGSSCKAANGTCVLGSGSRTCATRAPSSAQDCNPEVNPGGSFCCLTTGDESDAEADARGNGSVGDDGSTGEDDASVGCGVTMGGSGPGVNETTQGQVIAIAFLASGPTIPMNQYQLSMEYPSYEAMGDTLPDGAAQVMSGCSCQMGVSDPPGNNFPGPVLLESATGATLATLMPRFGSAPNALGWSPGQTLEVCAKDNPMDSFAGSLRTAPLPSGITPPIGATPSVAHASQGFTVSWSPDNGGGDQVTVGIGQQVSPDISCTCTAPDSAGSVTFDSTLLSQFDTQASPGPYIVLSRTTTSTVHSGEANIELLGEIVVEGTVAFQ